MGQPRAVFTPKPGNDDIRLYVDMRHANKAILRERLPIPTLDDVLEELCFPSWI